MLQDSPTTNFGTLTTLASDRSPSAESLFRFDVGGLSGSVTGATLRFWVTSGTVDAPVVHAAPNSWTEAGVTWATRPTTGAVITDTGAIAKGTWLEYAVTPAITGNGGYSFRLVPESSDGLDVLSRESASGTRPQLVVTTTGTTTATPIATPTPRPTVTPAPTTAPTPAPSATPAPTATPVAGSAYYVSTSGNDSNAGTLAAPWRTLQQAANRVPAGTTVYVRAGTYAGFAMTRSGTATARIVFAGYPGDPMPTVTGTSGTSNVIRITGAHDIEIRGLQVRGAPSQWGAGIRVEGGSYRVAVVDNTLRENHSFGVKIADSTEVTVAGNLITKNDTGIEISQQGAGIRIIDNDLVDNDTMVVNDSASENDRGANGIVFYKSTGAIVVADNRISGHRAPSMDYGYDGGAFEIYGASNITFERNTTWDNEAVVETGTDGTLPCDNNAFVRNVAYGGALAGLNAEGLILRCASNMLVAHNTFSDLDRFVYDVNSDASLFGGSIEGLRIVNNIAVTGDRVYSIDSVLPTSVVIDYNLSRNTTGGSLAYVFGRGNTSSLATFQSWTGDESHGLSADPLWVNGAGQDFRLTSASPAIGRAVPTAGESFVGTAPDMGRHEYTGSTAPTPSPSSTPAPTVNPTPTSVPSSTPAPTMTPQPTSTPQPTATATPATSRFGSVADAHVIEAAPSVNYGSLATMEVDQAPNSEAYLRFDVSGLTGPVTSATLRLYVTSATANGPGLYSAANTWTEGGVTWTNRPLTATFAVANTGAVADESWLEYTVTSTVTGNGTFSFRLAPESGDGMDIETREAPASVRPELVVSTNGGVTPTATPQPSASATATASATPIATPRPSTSPTPAPTAPPAGTATVIAAVGDIHGEGTDSDARATADLVDAINPAAVLGLGDYQYSVGTCANFMTSGRYHSDWGRHNDLMYPVLGPTHDYNPSSGAEAQRYFSGQCAGQPEKAAGALVAGGTLEWNEAYSFDKGGWHFVALPSLCFRYGCDTAAITAWLRADLAAHPTQCTVAYFHEAYWTSPSTGHDRDTATRPWVQALYDGGVELLLQGHQHSYERFAPQNLADQVDTARGIRSFVVGTGGIGFYPAEGSAANSQAFQANTHGVLQLTLRAGTYDWAFRSVAGGSYTDAGSGTCH